MNKRDRLTPSSATSTSPSDSWAVALVRHAARRAPGELSARLEEEWLADLTEHSGALSRLRFALDCCWARRVICHDPQSYGVTAQRAAAGTAVLAGYAPPRAPFAPRRTPILLLIIALHGVAIYGFSQGLGNHVIKMIEREITGKVINESQNVDVPPPVPAPPSTSPQRSERSWDDVIRESPRIAITDDPGTMPADEPAGPARDTDPIATARPVKRIGGGPGAGFPSTEEFYPSMSRQLGEKGAAAVQVCVDSRGRLAKAPEIGESSGIARLDAAALALAKAGSGHYRSTTEDGQPVASCFGFRVRFELR